MVDEARERLTRESCPRLYCWYWHSLGFDWDMPPDQGCEVAERHHNRVFWAGQAVAPWQHCCRATGNSQHQAYYEPREPHLEADGWPADFFRVVGKVARTRQFERRQRGERRRSDEADA
jgi:hypothetical protein